MQRDRYGEQENEVFRYLATMANEGHSTAGLWLPRAREIAKEPADRASSREAGSLARFWTAPRSRFSRR
ncbi:hypothetical protein C5E08_03325 [Rathayibacter iranicus]|uniref:Uncharacterized protein n=1 Tax=Rathayibacter iranicus TaxID=59737 RepID=A0AAD2JG36_9MICO|nr:hypothetical protein C7V51_03320 [Rathayibacter iranicus]PPI62408.1 hypothetical protein C5E08_03325 [Rathayibacter iranicus]